MNILFTSSTPFHPLRGGVGRVTDTLCKELQKRGYQVFYLNADWVAEERKKYKYPAPVTILPIKNIDDAQCVISYRKYLTENKIDVVINQDALYVDFYNNVGDLPIKVISVIHNNPLMNYNHLLNDLLTLRNNSLLERMKRIVRCLLYLRVKKQLKEYIDKRFGNIILSSDKILMLSPYYVQSLKNFGISVENKFDYVYNPNSFPLQTSLFKKKKEIIYVGRLDNRSKKVGRLIKVWSKVGKKYPDWNLTIVGDGPDRNQLEVLKKKYQVGNLTFEGFQSPIEYYKRASIICMTSSFEGFPMVLVEAMQFGCVPIAFDSFEAIHDVIIPEKTGELVKPFKIKDYINKLSHLIDDDTKRTTMSDAASMYVARFDVKTIADRWEYILETL
ncbi:glycosyltransferase [Segatella copri]|uniref:glycosyltransferase n=1 Tax=Segatella copri TaxID=165179 RepID=UPI002FF32462